MGLVKVDERDWKEEDANWNGTHSTEILGCQPYSQGIKIII